METSTIAYIAAALGVAALAHRLQLRLELSAAKHPSLAGHSRLARRMAALVPHYEYNESEFFGADDAPVDVVEQRRAGFMRLAALYAERYAKTVTLTREVEDEISDLQFTDRYRVPFQFRGLVCKHLKSGSFVESSAGVRLTDLDGNQLYDLGGSYGVNLFGYDFYKECIERGAARVHALGPVLGAYHPVVVDNVARLRRISGLDEVSFHMSGTEAVMQAVRLARYHTRRSHVVRFCGAYHGWWGDVQPGVGNPMPADSTYTLKDMDNMSLRVLSRRKDIACVLVSQCTVRIAWPMRTRAPSCRPSQSAKPGGTSTMTVDPCSNQPISSPLPSDASQAITFGPRYFRCSSTSRKCRRILATSTAATGTSAIVWPVAVSRQRSTARSFRQNSFSMRFSATGLTL